MAAKDSLLWCLCFLGVAYCWCPPEALAQANPRQTEKPILLILKIGQPATFQKREAGFIAELGLILDTYHIVSVDKSTARCLTDFSTQPLKKRLALIKALARSQKAAATIWLEEGDENKTLLYLVAISSGRVLVRILESEEGPNTEVTLAMAVEEIVGQAYLFNAENPAAALETIPASVVPEKEASPPLGRSTVCPDKSSGALFVRGVGRVGIAGVHGPRLTGGGGTGIAYKIGRLVSMNGGFNIISGPFQETDQQRVRNLSVEPHVGVALIRARNRYSLGGGFSVAVPWQQTVITLPSTGDHVYRDWNIRFSLGFNFVFHINTFIALDVSPDLGVWLDQTRYFSESTDRDIIINPRLDAGLHIGIILKN